jgi:hypothetical protein
MTSYYITYLVYPDKSPVWFLLFMLGVIALGIWRGMKE